MDNILEALEARGANLVGTVDYLISLRDRCREGIPQDKVSQGEVYTLIERYPNAELATTKAIFDIYKYVEEQMALGQAKAPITIQIEYERLEPIPDPDFSDPDLD